MASKPKAKSAAKAKPAAKSKPVAKAAKPAAHSALAVRVAAVLGVGVEEATEQAIREMAERLGLHKLAGPAASATSARSEAAEQVAPPRAMAGTRGAKGEGAAGKSSAGKTIPSTPLDTTPLPARTLSSSSPARDFSPNSLPKRLYLALDGRMPLEVIDLPCTLGSSRRNTIWINSPRIETHHARIVETPEGWVIEDLGSEHGTLFEGERITRRVLENGDLFLLAGYLRMSAELR